MSTFAELAAHLDRCAEQLPDVVDAAERVAAAALLSDLQLNSPVSEDPDSGEYASSWQPVEEGNGVATAHPAGPSLEFGSHGHDRLGRRRNITAQPHLRPAVSKTRARERIIGDVQKLLR